MTGSQQQEGRAYWRADVDEVEARFRRVFFQGRIAQALTSLEDGSILAVNREWCRMLGYSEQELFVQDVQSITHPEDLAFTRDALRRMMAGESVPMPMRKRYVRRDGSISSVDLYVEVIRDEDGAPRYGHALVFDATERLELAQRLHHQEVALDLALEAGGDFGLVLDHQGIVRCASRNAAAVFGGRDPTAHDVMELVGGAAAAELRRALTALIVEGHDHGRVSLQIGTGAALRHWDLHLRQTEDDELVAVFVDVTEHARAAAVIEGGDHILRLLLARRPRHVLLDAVARLAEEQLPGVRTAILLNEGGRLRYGAAPSMPTAYVAAVDGLPVGSGHGSCGTAVAEGTPVVVEDVREHPAWAPYRELAMRHGIRSCWSLPVRDGEGQVIAAFAFYRVESPGRPAAFEWEYAHHLAVLVAVVLTHDQSTPLPAQPTPPAGETPLDALTSREREVFTLVALGHTNREIADRLFMGLRTVEGHRASVNRKLGLHKRSELVKIALDAGLLRP